MLECLIDSDANSGARERNSVDALGWASWPIAVILAFGLKQKDPILGYIARSYLKLKGKRFRGHFDRAEGDNLNTGCRQMTANDRILRSCF